LKSGHATIYVRRRCLQTYFLPFQVVDSLRRRPLPNNLRRLHRHRAKARLFEAISLRNKLYARFCIFLIDTGARLGEGIGLRWADIQNRRVSFWITKGGRSLSSTYISRFSGNQGIR
jgi:integrase